MRLPQQGPQYTCGRRKYDFTTGSSRGSEWPWSGLHNCSSIAGLVKCSFCVQLWGSWQGVSWHGRSTLQGLSTRLLVVFLTYSFVLFLQLEKYFRVLKNPELRVGTHCSSYATVVGCNTVLIRCVWQLFLDKRSRRSVIWKTCRSLKITNWLGKWRVMGEVTVAEI